MDGLMLRKKIIVLLLEIGYKIHILNKLLFKVYASTGHKQEANKPHKYKGL